MYQESMNGIRENLVKKGSAQSLVFTVELHPAGQRPDGVAYVVHSNSKGFFDLCITLGAGVSPKQDHLVCFQIGRAHV